jgi:hypothetical protein
MLNIPLILTVGAGSSVAKGKSPYVRVIWNLPALAANI